MLNTRNREMISCEAIYSMSNVMTVVFLDNLLIK